MKSTASENVTYRTCKNIKITFFLGSLTIFYIMTIVVYAVENEYKRYW